MSNHLVHHHLLLVLFSVIIAFLSCFAAVDFADRLARAGKGRSFILMAACVLGSGMWAMHFIGMRAMKLGIPVTYDLSLLLFSLIIPIAASYVMFGLLNNRLTHGKLQLGFGGLVLSSGILLMHYSGVLAMRLPASYSQTAWSVIASGLFSLFIPLITVCYTPKWVEKAYNMFSLYKFKLVALLTVSLTGTHYAAMAGAAFTPVISPGFADHGFLLDDWQLGLVLGGTFIGLAAVVLIMLFRDRQEVLQSAKLSEQRYMALFESNPDMVVCLDPVRKRVVSANPALRRMTGYDKEELRDYKHILDKEEDQTGLKAAVERAAQGVSAKLELAVRTKTGGNLICSTTVFPLINSDQCFVYIVAEDISALVAYQEELIVAKEAAESAARIKTEFMATMSHEIRTPLNGIIGINQLLADELRDPGQLEMLKLQYSSSQALLNVMNDILDYSRLEAHGLPLQMKPIQLRQLIQESVHLFAAAAKDKSLGLTLRVDELIPEQVLGDSTRIRQILVNLIGNAVKFTESGDIQVSVHALEDSGGRISVQFRIKDTGIGIAPEKLGLLFQPFSQLDASYSRRYSGTGLGLAISRKLVELMDGMIWAEPAEGGGTIFSFTAKLQICAEARQTRHTEGGERVATEAV